MVLIRLKKAAIAAALVCVSQMSALADSAPALTKSDVDAWLDGYLPYALRQGDIAGAVVVVVKDGSILTQRGFGYADLETRQPMDPERTLMRVGSISKLFTWTALMQLVERGQVVLDADVNTYSNYATALAGYIVERISGTALEDYMDSRVLGPLGMTSSTFVSRSRVSYSPGWLRVRRSFGAGASIRDRRPRTRRRVVRLRY